MAPLPYPGGDGPGVDEPFPTEDVITDAEMIGQVWSFKADPEPEEPQRPLKNAKKQVQGDLLASMMAISAQDDVPQSHHLISPSRKQQLTEKFKSSATPFTKMFKLPSYTTESKDTSPAMTTTSLQKEVIVEVPSEESSEIHLLPDENLPHSGLASAAAAAAASLSSAGVPLGRVLSDHSITAEGDALERAEIKRDARKLSVVADPWYATKQAAKAANFKFAVDTFSSAPRSLHRDVPIPSPTHPRDLEDYPPESFPITVNVVKTGLNLAESKSDEVRRRKQEEARREDERREIGQKQYLKLVLRHVRTRLIQEGKFVEIPASEYGGGHHHHHHVHRSSSPTQFSGRSSPVPSEDDPGMNEYAAQLAIERRDRWKGEASPAPSPKLGPSSSGMRWSKSASALSHVVTSQALPDDIASLDVYREITGKPRPRSVGGVKTPGGSPIHTGLKGGMSSPTAGGKPLPSPSPRTPQESLSAWTLPPAAIPPGHARGRSQWNMTAKEAMLLAATQQQPKDPPAPDPLAHLPFHIDPLDPSRPENRSKRYRFNMMWTPPPQGEWPLETRGPEHDWQELTDEEEIAAYKKVLWLCEIKALAHITLDSMLDLLSVTIERAFDVEILLRSGEPGDSVFFIKAGEVQLKMERKVVEEMEEQRVLTELSTSQMGLGDGPMALSLHPHPSPQQSTSGTTSHLLPTDPELLNKYVEIAKLGPMGICGEDILIASHRRYTVVSLTPVWVYAIKADALLKCFTDEARENFLLAIAHTQRVRERHALVKSRTRAQFHQFPTSFHHFIDESLKRPLGRPAKRADAPGQNGRAISPTRHAQALMSEEDRAALLFAGGGPDALRAVLQDLRSISEAQARHRYLPQSPERVEKLVRRAAYNKDRHALAQRDMMQQRQKSEARGGLLGAEANSPSKGGPPVIPGLNFASPARALPMPRSSQLSSDAHTGAGRKKLLSKEVGGLVGGFFAGDVEERKGEEKEEFMTRGGFFTPQRSLPTLASLQQKFRGGTSPNPQDSTANDHVAMQHIGGRGDGDRVVQRSVTVGRGPSTSPQKIVLPLDQRLAATLAQTEAVKRAQEEALSGVGPAAELIKAQMLGQTPAGRSRSIAAMHQEREEFLRQWISEEGNQQKEKELLGFMQPMKKDAAAAASKKDLLASKKDATPKIAVKTLSADQSNPDLRHSLLGRRSSLTGPLEFPSSVLSPIVSSAAASSMDEYSASKPGHRRRISHLVTATGQKMYDSPFSKPLQTIHDAPTPNGPASVAFEPVVLESTPIKKLVYSTSSDTLPGPLVRKPSSGLIAVLPERGTLGSPEKKRPQPVNISAGPAHQRSLSSEDIDPRTIVASPTAAATFATPQHVPMRSPVARHSPSLNNTSLSGSSSTTSSYSSPFAMEFSVNSVFEKSGMHHSSVGATQNVFQSTKQHVARNTVAPLRTQLSSLVVLGDKPNEQVYQNPAEALNPVKVARSGSRDNSPPKIKRQISTATDRLQAKLVASATLQPTGSS